MLNFLLMPLGETRDGMAPRCHCVMPIVLRRVASWIWPAALIAVGAVLRAAVRSHPAAMPWAAPYSFSWGVFLGCSTALVCYLRGVGRLAPADRPAVGRHGLYAAGVALFYLVLQTRFDLLAQHQFAFSRLQHLTTHHLAPFLIAIAQPGPVLAAGMPRPLRAVLRRLAPALGHIQRPVPACVLFVGLVYLWLIPAVHFASMLDPLLYDVMNASMAIDGLLFWFVIFGTEPSPSLPLRIVLVLAVQLPQIMLGGAIAAADVDLYPAYALCGRLFPGIGPMLDQQIGGAIIAWPAGMMSALAALFLMRRMWSQERVYAPASSPAAGS